MPTTNYYSIDGEVFGESTDGVMTTYMKDAQGSVIGTIQAGGVVNTYAYTPYGRLLAKTGSGPDPRFMWNGGNQYRTTGRQHAEEYVVARHYDSTQGRWTTVDPTWPGEPAFTYGDSNPCTVVDASGTIGCGGAFTILNSPNGVPSNTALTAAGCGSCNQVPLSPGLMTCLWEFEGAGKFPTTGDTGVGPGNITPGEIAAMCAKGSNCMKAILGTDKLPWKTQTGCIKYFENPHNWKDQLKLAAAVLACKGWASYGYKSSCWQSAFESCAGCITIVMVSRSMPPLMPGCPPINIPCDPCFTPIDDCNQQVVKARKAKQASK